jgi:prefoldin alpha subunit
MTDEDMQNELARLEEYRNQAGALLRQQEIIRISIAEHQRARDTLEELERLDTGREILAPVGAETFVKVIPGSTERVILGLGCGFVVEVERVRGLEMLNERIGRLDRAQQEMVNQLQQLDNEAQALSQRLEAAIKQKQQKHVVTHDGKQ